MSLGHKSATSCRTFTMGTNIATYSESWLLFYAQETVAKGWNRDLLLNAINLNMYGAQALAKVDNNFDRTLPAEQAKYANEVFNSNYNLGFLGVTSPIRRTQRNPNCLILSS